MDVDRMRTLERLARQIPPALLWMENWFSERGEWSDDIQPGGDCGTVACLAGHATRCPEFYRQGLRVDDGYQPCYYDPVQDPEADEMSYGFYALEKFFGLTHDQVMMVFSASGYRSDPTPAQVADRVKELIETHEAGE